MCVSLGHIGRGVTDDARHDEDRDAPVERVCDEGMTEIVEREARRYPRPLLRPVERLLDPLVRLPLLVCEDILRTESPRNPSESIREACGHRDIQGSPRLRVMEVDISLREVHVCPPESKHIA